MLFWKKNLFFYLWSQQEVPKKTTSPLYHISSLAPHAKAAGKNGKNAFLWWGWLMGLETFVSKLTRNHTGSDSGLMLITKVVRVSQLLRFP